jgi:hypothetical protein
VRRIILLTVAGVASAYCTLHGFVYVYAEWNLGLAPRSVVTLSCIFPILSLVVFGLYFLRPRLGLVVSMLLLTCSFLVAYLIRLRICLQLPCSIADSIRMGWQTLVLREELWAQALSAACLLFDYTAPTPHATLAVPPEGSDQDLRT